jgi:hypothetical protein
MPHNLYQYDVHCPITRVKKSYVFQIYTLTSTGDNEGKASPPIAPSLAKMQILLSPPP